MPLMTRAVELLGRRGAGFGGVDRARARFSGDGQLLVGERQRTDDGVMEALDTGAVGADVVVGQKSAESAAPGREFADEVL